MWDLICGTWLVGLARWDLYVGLGWWDLLCGTYLIILSFIPSTSLKYRVTYLTNVKVQVI